MINLKCNNLFCEHPWALGFGFLILAILVILLMYESYKTNGKRRGNGGGEHPQDTRPPGFGAEQSYDEPLRVTRNAPDDYLGTGISTPAPAVGKALPTRHVGSDKVLRELEEIEIRSHPEQETQRPIEQPIPVPQEWYPSVKRERED